MNRRAGLLTMLVACAVLAVPAATQAADWTTWGNSPGRIGFTLPDATLNPMTVKTLHLAWAAHLDSGPIDTQPIVSNGRVFVGTEHGLAVALDATTGRVLWKRNLGTVKNDCHDLPGGQYGTTASPAVDVPNNRVIYTDTFGRVHALDVATGRERPGWPVSLGLDTKTEHVWGGMQLYRGRVYVANSSYCGLGRYHGHVFAVDLARPRVVARWQSVRTTSRLGGGGIWGWGGVAVDPAGGDLYVATGNALSGTPETVDEAEHVVRLSLDLKVKERNWPHTRNYGDADFGAFPMAFQARGCPTQIAVTHKTGRMFIYDARHIAHGPKQEVQVGDRNRLIATGEYAFSPATNMVYVGNQAHSSRDATTQGLIGYAVGKDCRLRRRFMLPFGPDRQIPASPVVAGDVVFESDGEAGDVYAADARTGTLLWNARLPGPVFAAPSVADGTLYTVAWDGVVRALRP